jgi:hypothetical protein
LTDAQGREVLSLTTHGVQLTIDRGELPSGTYLYSLVSKSGQRHAGRLGIQ